MTKSEVDAMLGREEKSLCIIYLSRSEASYIAEVTTKPYLIGFVTLLFQKFDDRKENTREHVVRFLNSMRGHAYDADLCMSNSPSSCLIQTTPGTSI